MGSASDVCVSVSGVSKKFSRSLKHSFIYGAQDLCRAITGRKDDPTLRQKEFWAVQDVSFELKRGECLGIVGLNGSGKTTLMRMIAGILNPSVGRIDVAGRIAPMLALGAGFKPVLSGRENVFLNLSILGVPYKDIQARFDSIVDFAELWDAIDAPLGTYSSGMLSRLGFACAVHTDPQILVVDEVLSVGDTQFRVKCRNRINELRKSGTSMLLVSHSSILIETLSDQCLYLKHGRIAALGSPGAVLREYDEDMHAGIQDGNAQISQKLVDGAQQAGSDPVVITNLKFSTPGTADFGGWLTGRPGEMVLSFSCPHACDQISINVMLFDLEAQSPEPVLFLVSSSDQGWMRLNEGELDVRLVLPAVGLKAGVYRVKISISQGAVHDILAVVDQYRLVVRDSGRAKNCAYYQPRDWFVTGGEIIEKVQADDLCIEDVETF